MNNRKIKRVAAFLLILILLLNLAPSLGLLALGPTPVFINELHYDNASTDVGEGIEVAGPAGTDLTGWTIALYNGSATQLNVYDTIELSGIIPDQQNGFGTLWFPRAGIQNGAPDGFALVDSGGNVLQFLSYEGTFTAASGPAVGMTSTDIGVEEGSSTLVDQSLQLTGAGSVYEDFTWNPPAMGTPDAVNNGQNFEGAVGGTPFTNELHYDNAGADVDEGIEVAGPAGTDLSGWSIVLYNGNGGASYGTIALSGTIPDQQNGYGTRWFAQPGIQNGSPDGFALVAPDSTVVQFLSYEGTFTAAGGPADGMLSTDIGVSETGSEPVGNSLQLAGTGTAYDDFTWRSSAPSTYDNVNNDQSFGEVVNAPVVIDCGGTLYVDQASSAYRDVTASDADGTVTSMAITSISPSSEAITLENFQPAAEVGGQASATVTVWPDVDAGTFSVEVTATNDDAPSQSGSCTFNVVVNPFLTIGEVQGIVSDTDDGASHPSPYVGQTVLIQGVIYEKLLTRTSSGSSNYAFFIQNTAATADGDPNSSDGIYVYIGYYSTLRKDGGGYYTPQVGDEVILRGPVSEYYNLTEIGNPYLVQIVRGEVPLNDEVPAFEANPPSELADANRYWERREGMRAQVPVGSVVLNGRDVFASTMDGEVWVATPDSVIAQRADPYTRRAFRDSHPLDDIPDQLFDNGNGYRVLMGSLGIKATAGENTALIAPARTFDTLTNAPIGGVYYSYGKYSVQVGQQIELADGADPALNAPPQALDRTLEYSVVTFNVENLYDYYDDPFDGCDFIDNAGCPGVSPPFDYVPPSDDVYQARLNDIAHQIVDNLHSPDIIMAQEAEDQDTCAVVEGIYKCPDPADAVDNADGKPDTLQELAAAIASIGGPPYDAAYDRDGTDDRGIISAYLYRTDRVELLPAQEDDPVLGSDPQVVYPDSDPLPYNTDVQNPKVLNAVLPDWVTGDTDGDNVFTRAPQVGLFRIWRDGIGGSVFEDLYLVDNHFSSGPDGRVGQRTEQANYNAAIVAALQMADPGVYVSVGGDLNVYPRPDDPFLPPDTSDQLAGLYNQGLTNLWNVLVDDMPASAYSYVYEGQAQTLDQIFVASPWLDELANVWSAHINSDFPSDHPGDGPRGTSDHDPLVAGYTLLPTLDRLEALVRYYDANGDITGNNTTRQLLDRLDRARWFQENGQQQAYEDQMWAFVSQIWDKTPEFITEPAATALVQEATLLLNLP